MPNFMWFWYFLWLLSRKNRNTFLFIGRNVLRFLCVSLCTHCLGSVHQKLHSSFYVAHIHLGVLLRKLNNICNRYRVIHRQVYKHPKLSSKMYGLTDVFPFKQNLRLGFTHFFIRKSVVARDTQQVYKHPKLPYKIYRLTDVSPFMQNLRLGLTHFFIRISVVVEF